MLARVLTLCFIPSSVSMQDRAFALQAAGAQCAIATGNSSTPEQIAGRRRKIKEACGHLAALSARDGFPCRYPTPGTGREPPAIREGVQEPGVMSISRFRKRDDLVRSLIRSALG